MSEAATLPDAARPVAGPVAGHVISDVVRTGTILAVASGKGGVGKTWLAITLAHALARSGARVLLFDGDFGLANIDVQLGLAASATDLSAVISGRLALPAAVSRLPAGFDLLAGQSGSGALASLPAARLEALLAALRQAASSYDHVILDLGAGLERATRRLAVFADTLLVLATDEPTSLTDAYAVMKLHAQDRAQLPSPRQSGPPRVVVNQAATAAAGRRTHATLARACQHFLGFSPELAGIVRRDEQVRMSIRRQALLLDRAPACFAALDVAAMARTL